MISTNTVVKIMSLPGVGRRTAFKLLKSLKHPIYGDSDIRDFINENRTILRSTLSPSDLRTAFDKAENVISKSEQAGIRIVTYFDDSYPRLLKAIDDPALLLSIKGSFQKINYMPSVGIIGTRGPSDFGYKVGIRLGEIFGEAGFNVVSGLAIGCDTAGHIGCLNRHGFTTAVLAHGLDTIYPKDNKQLAEKILDSGGLLLSEYLIGQRPQANFFVERDRIQAGLSQGIIVIETDIKGGTMHTVKFASNNKRVVATFNHEAKYLSHPKTQGNQYLINNKTAIPLSNTESIEALKNTLLDLAKFALPGITEQLAHGDPNAQLSLDEVAAPEIPLSPVESAVNLPLDTSVPPAASEFPIKKGRKTKKDVTVDPDQVSPPVIKSPKKKVVNRTENKAPKEPAAKKKASAGGKKSSKKSPVDPTAPSAIQLDMF